jgi:hypothetical protein
MRKLKIDKRFKSVKNVYLKSRTVFQQNYMFNHSFGESPSDERIEDFAQLVAYIQTAQIKGVEKTNFDWKEKYLFPSKNVGTLRDLTNMYRNGFEMLHDLGLYDPVTDQDFISYEEEFLEE